MTSDQYLTVLTLQEFGVTRRAIGMALSGHTWRRIDAIA